MTAGILALAAVSFLSVPRSAAAAPAPPKARPNVVLCMADDQGLGDMGYTGHPRVQTPTFDAMSREGLRFDRFYAAAPVCSPTRGSIMTGRHPNRFGCFSWGRTLRPQEITVAEALQQAGYRTGHFGKWHLGSVDESWVDRIEDIELGARLLRNGHRIRLVKDLQVKHLKKWRLASMLATDLWRRAVPWTELMLREGEVVNDLNVRSWDRVSVVAAFVALAALPAAGLWPPALLVAVAATVLVVALNAPLFRFFRRQRGLLFAAGTVPLYWLFLLVCGLGASLGVPRHLRSLRRSGQAG